MVADLHPARTAASAAGFGRILRGIAPTFRIRDERPGDAPAREALLDAVFGPARFTKTCERLREGRAPAEGLSFAAFDGGALVGTLRFWHVECGRTPALLLGPLAVAGSHRAAGIGGALIAHGLRRATRLGHAGVVLVGDAPYYARFGFAAARAARLVMPGPVDPARLLGLELRLTGLAGAEGRVVGAGLIADIRNPRSSRQAA